MEDTHSGDDWVVGLENEMQEAYEEVVWLLMIALVGRDTAEFIHGRLRQVT